MSVQIDKNSLLKFKLYKKLDVVGKHIIIGDLGQINKKPSKKSIWVMSTKVPVKPATYNSCFYVDELGKFGKRVMGVLFIREDVQSNILKGKEQLTFKRIGEIGVDVGAIGFVNEDNNLSEDFFVDLKLPAADKQGIYVPSGMGDGMYPYFFAKEGTTIVGIYVDFYGTFVKERAKKESPIVANKIVSKNIKISEKRPSPSASATDFPIGTIKKGNDRNNWIVVKTEAGVKRWKKHEKRPSPSASATSFPTGTVKKGNDGNQWTIVKNALGVKRWKKN